jgi:hypothetical protein
MFYLSVFVGDLILVRFCAYMQRGPVKIYTTLSIKILHTFLEWVLNQRRGEGGRRLPGIKAKSSLETFWKVYRLVYERATGGKINLITTC